FNFIPPALVSSGEYLTFEFDANNTNAGFGGNAGFVGSLTCFGEPFDVYNMSSGAVNACSGAFYDDGGPNQPFTEEQERTQTFCSDIGEHIQFRFNNNVNLADSGDTLWVYDGSSTADILIGYYIQGSSIERLTSSGTCLTFKFKSNTSTEPGWQGFITCVPEPPVQDTINISSGLRAVCNAIVSDNSGAFAYGQGFNRQTYRSYNGQRLRFVYSLFSINGNNGGHWLRIYDGPDQSYPLIGAYNNFNFIPATIESTGEFLTFEFDRNNTNAGFGSAQGYSGLMTCFGEALPIYTIGNSLINVCEGVFYDDGGPNLNYQANGDYVQTFCSESGQLLQLQFNRNESSFGSGDTLWVYDGASISDPPLAMFIAGSTIETLTSTGTCLTFKFTSNSSSQARGWQGLISCVNEPPAIINYAMSTGIRYVCNGVFRDPGGTGDYPDGTWNQTFTSYSGERLRVVVNGININGNNGGHWIRVYDGPSTASPLIGSYNNFNGWPPAFESTGSSLTFRFESTNTFAGNTSGFEFEFSCFTNAAIDVEWLPSPICRGGEIQIPFTLNDPVNTGNVFTAQLSDANGSFANAINIGSFSSISNGVIDATIPLSAIEGSGYRIRVISSNPVQLGSVNPNNLIINPTPNQPSSILSSNGASICENESTILSIPTQNSVTYSWLLNGDALGLNTSSIEVTDSGTYSIELSNSCGSITSSANLQLSTTPIPSVPVISGPQNAAICQGDETQLSTPDQNGVSFNWTLGGSTISENTNIINVSEGGAYLVSASNTCGSSTAVSSYNLLVEAAPEINLAELQEVSCFGGSDGSIDLEIVGATQVVWSNGSLVSDISNLSSGSYSIAASSLAGCESEMTYSISEPEAIEVFADAMPETGNSSNGSITLLISGGTPPYSFNWSNGESTQDIQGLQSGSYSVEVTDSLGCLFEGSFIVDIVTSTSNLNNIYKVLPNPCVESFFIESDEELIWQLFDSSGRMVISSIHREARSKVSVNHLPSGLYLFNAVNTKGEYSLKRLVIQ
ncbi:MAG: T9SS type A sorting domain-containing protein, partial [Bacteroidia bacterium]